MNPLISHRDDLSLNLGREMVEISRGWRLGFSLSLEDTGEKRIEIVKPYPLKRSIYRLLMGLSDLSLPQVWVT